MFAATDDRCTDSAELKRADGKAAWPSVPKCQSNDPVPASQWLLLSCGDTAEGLAMDIKLEDMKWLAKDMLGRNAAADFAAEAVAFYRLQDILMVRPLWMRTCLSDVLMCLSTFTLST